MADGTNAVRDNHRDVPKRLPAGLRKKLIVPEKLTVGTGWRNNLSTETRHFTVGRIIDGRQLRVEVRISKTASGWQVDGINRVERIPTPGRGPSNYYDWVKLPTLSEWLWWATAPDDKIRAKLPKRAEVRT